jgi:hypothetical protein
MLRLTPVDMSSRKVAASHQSAGRRSWIACGVRGLSV